MNRAERRQAEEALAQMTARRQALEELERDRVGLAPAAAALLAARDRFEGGRARAAERFRQHRPAGRRAGRAAAGRLDACRAGPEEDTVKAIQSWHAEQQPGALVLLPLDPGPVTLPGPASGRPAAGRGAGGRLGPCCPGRVGGSRRLGPDPPAGERRHFSLRRGRALRSAPPPGGARGPGPGSGPGRSVAGPGRRGTALHGRTAGGAGARAGGSRQRRRAGPGRGAAGPGHPGRRGPGGRQSRRARWRTPRPSWSR